MSLECYHQLDATIYSIIILTSPVETPVRGYLGYRPISSLLEAYVFVQQQPKPSVVVR